ncbi:hypothetical protein OEZ85_001681 [Tetradesmus obliquus]|uniref:Uncharacterized protein n=1 Tax=Tetradesmus obliquus TaxID=3088 RepID=A0ABY8U3D6_TETOB|nr:hypothetical protein OEZ85_001681 [Tetradesmus obliquus]
MVTPRAVVGRLSALTQLTCLVLGVVMLGGTASVHLLATVGQLAAALAPLTALQELCIKGFVSVAADAGAAAGKPKSRSKAGSTTGSAGGGVVAQHGADGVVALLQALAGLSRLHAVHVELPVAMTQQDASRAATAAQGMPGWVSEARVWEGDLQTAIDSAAYAVGAKNELKGTGVWGFIKASRKPAEAAPAPTKPQKPVPRKPDVTKPPSQR